MSHYFIDDDNLDNNYKRFPYAFGGKKFEFITNSGIFSPDGVDAATDTLLRNIPPLSGTLLDLGCGWGVIGVILGALFNLDVTMSDINPRALDCARQNAKNNGVDAKIVLSDCFEAIDEKFDTIILNPPIHAGKQVIYKMYEGAAKHLNQAGNFFIVIQKKHGAESTIRKLNELFESCNTIYKKKGVYVIACQKPKIN